MLEVDKLPTVIREYEGQLADPNLEPQVREDIEARLDSYNSQLSEHQGVLEVPSPKAKRGDMLQRRGKKSGATIDEGATGVRDTQDSALEAPPKSVKEHHASPKTPPPDPKRVAELRNERATLQDEFAPDVTDEAIVARTHAKRDALDATATASPNCRRHGSNWQKNRR